ncbi:alcohol dehydrogenase GroES domain protein [Trametes maxima]|nr:alcohol dehydrogenase GroES domain protein [Trametes maxima]
MFVSRRYLNQSPARDKSRSRSLGEHDQVIGRAHSVVWGKTYRQSIYRCGICGTDLSIYYGTLSETFTSQHLPRGIGHEFSGTIIALGPKVDAIKYAVGQNVAIEPIIACRQSDCTACSSPTTRNICPRKNCFGLSSPSGGLSEYVVVDPELAHILPSNVPLEIGALMEPLAVSWRAIKKSQVKPGDSVLILGAGPIGIFALEVAKVFGASWVAISGRGTKRCDLARQRGASAVYNISLISDEDIIAETLKATGGRGVDVVVDCAGRQNTLDMSLKATRLGGTIMNAACWEESPAIDMNVMLAKEIVLKNSFGYAGDHPEVIEAVAQGRFVNLEGLVTLRVPLDDFVGKGLRALTHEKDKHMKVLIRI